MNYENFNSCDNLGDTFEYMEVKETTATIEDLEELELFKTVARCGLIKEREFYGKGIRGTALNYNIKQEIKDLGVKVSIKTEGGVGVSSIDVTVKSKEDKKDLVIEILKTYLVIDHHEFNEDTGEYAYNPKCKYGSVHSIALYYNDDEKAKIYGYKYICD